MMKGFLNGLSIRKKVFIYMSIFCLVLILSMWLLQVVLLPSSYQYIRQKQCYSAADKIERILLSNEGITSQNMEQDEKEKADELLRDIASEYDSCIIITDNRGWISYSLDTLRMCQIHRMPPQQLTEILKKARDDREVYILSTDSSPMDFDRKGFKDGLHYDPEQIQSIIYCRRVKNGDRTVGYLLLNMQLTPVSSSIVAIRYTLYGITGLLLILAVIMSFMISKRVADPIKKLNEESKALGRGEYDTVFDAEGYREINELSGTLTEASRQLGKVDRLRQEFIANVSHDLRTPLTLIGGYAEVMRDVPGENNPENAQIIIDEANRLSGLVNDVLDTSKIRSGAIEMSKSEYDIAAYVKDTVHRFSEMLKNDGYSIEYSGPETLTVNADRARIGQCIYNMLINAVDHTGDDKKVYVDLSADSGKVTFTVTDTGEGVREEDLPYVWDRYFKTDKKHKRSIIGSGIGLYIVKRIIDAHGGSCGAQNTKDMGAGFWFTIPEN